MKIHFANLMAAHILLNHHTLEHLYLVVQQLFVPNKQKTHNNQFLYNKSSIIQSVDRGIKESLHYGIVTTYLWNTYNATLC